jgi:hypothetical protein
VREAQATAHVAAAALPLQRARQQRPACSARERRERACLFSSACAASASARCTQATPPRSRRSCVEKTKRVGRREKGLRAGRASIGAAQCCAAMQHGTRQRRAAASLRAYRRPPRPQEHATTAAVRVTWRARGWRAPDTHALSQIDGQMLGNFWCRRSAWRRWIGHGEHGRASRSSLAFLLRSCVIRCITRGLHAEGRGWT